MAGEAEGDDPPDAVLIARTETWFLNRGIPHFIDGYRATEDVFTRALPLLLVIFGLEVLGAANLEWVWWLNVAAVAGGLAVAVGAWAVINRVRGRRALQRPDTVGPVELATFVVVPPLLPLLFGTQAGSALVTALVNLALLGAIYLITSYGLVPMTRWALGQTARQVGTVLGLFGRALPLLLLFSVALFINTEVWQVAASLKAPLFWTTVLFFVLVGVVFLLLRLPGEVGRLRGQMVGSALVDACASSPLAEVARDLTEHGDVELVPLSRRQQGNVLLVLLFSQGVQIALITATISVFFFVFGMVALRPEVISSWLGTIDADVIATWDLFGQEVEVSWALVHAAGLIGILSGFYFTVYVITDATYRAEFFNEILGEVRQTLAVRNVYLAVVARHRGAGSA